MNYKSEYKKKLMSAESMVERIPSHSCIHIEGASGVPVAIEKALEGLIGEKEDIRVTTYMHFGYHTPFFERGDAAKTFQVESVFHNRSLMHADVMGVSSYIPTHLRNGVRDMKAVAPQIDWIILGVSPMDKNGYFTIANGALVDYELLPYAKHVAVEVLQNAPRLFGDTLVHISQVDAIVESGYGVAELPNRKPDEIDKQLGKQVAQFVEDGSTIQLGFGGLIGALVDELKSHHDLGIHSEVVNDSVMELLECGAVNNRKKTLYPGLSVSSFWAGSKEFSSYIDDNPGFMFRNVSYTNDPRILAENDRMTSINASMEVDLTGQCASESIGTKQFSGTGGQTDTAVGSQMAPGGKSVIAVRSTVDVKDPLTGERKIKSRIVPTLTPGVAVSLTRTNVHYVVTEYGAVCLRGLSIKERAKALISIAHPDFRAWLEEEFEKQYGLRLKKSKCSLAFCDEIL